MIHMILLFAGLNCNVGYFLQKNEIMEQAQHSEQVIDFARSIQWLGQATVKFIYKGQTIYIDPYQLKSDGKADLILITHDHMDHFSLPDIKKIAGKETRFIVAKACEEKLKNEGYKYVQSVVPGETVEISGLKVKAVPAYNIVKQYHKKAKNYLGFIIDFNGISVYHTGDTERIPEMKDIKCDIILVPLGQTYTMSNVEEAVEVVLDTKAEIAIPIHWGLYEGSKNDAAKFAELLKKRNVTVLPGRPDL
jgi:L-ascorbate metabolism protein UlaG (beta-lactamase superfamily)